MSAVRSAAVQLLWNSGTLLTGRQKSHFFEFVFAKLHECGGLAAEQETDAEEYLKAQQAEATGTFSFNVTEEMQQIKSAAEKDGTFMKAPNGAPSKLTEKQWLQGF